MPLAFFLPTGKRPDGKPLEVTVLLLDIQAGTELFRHKLAAGICLPYGWQTGTVRLVKHKAGARTLTWLVSTASTGTVVYHDFRIAGHPIPVRKSDGQVLPGFIVKAGIDNASKARLLATKNKFIEEIVCRAKEYDIRQKYLV